MPTLDDPVGVLPALDEPPWLAELAAHLLVTRNALRDACVEAEIGIRPAPDGRIASVLTRHGQGPDSAHQRMAARAEVQRFEERIDRLGLAPAWLHAERLSTFVLLTHSPLFVSLNVGSSLILLEEPGIADALCRVARVAAAGVSRPRHPSIERHLWPEWVVELIGAPASTIGPVTSIDFDEHTTRTLGDLAGPQVHAFRLRAPGPGEALLQIGWIAGVNGALRASEARVVRRVALGPNPNAEDQTEAALAALATMDGPTARLTAAVLRRCDAV